MSRLQQITFKGRFLWLVAEPNEPDGPLCDTPDDFKHGRESYAHLYGNGEIKRHGMLIGTFADLDFTGLCAEVEQTDDAWQCPWPPYPRRLVQ